MHVFTAGKNVPPPMAAATRVAGPQFFCFGKKMRIFSVGGKNCALGGGPIAFRKAIAAVRHLYGFSQERGSKSFI
jgi:hypothetical protein